MLYFVFHKTQGLTFILSSNDKDTMFTVSEFEKSPVHTVKRPHDFKTFDEAIELAQEASKFSEKLYIPVDNEGSYPRYDVILAPSIGEKISYAFNGDSRPCGEILKISDSYRRITSTEGQIFWRRRSTSVWKLEGTWSMVSGHVETTNPSF